MVPVLRQDAIRDVAVEAVSLMSTPNMLNHGASRDHVL